MGQMRDEIGGCGPVEPPTSDSQLIRAFLREILSLSPEDYRGVVIPIYVPLDGTTITNLQGQDSYRVPGTHVLAITNIEGFMAMPSWQNDDDDASSTNANTDALLGMMLAKAMTTMIRLSNVDRDSQIILGEGSRQCNLSSILGVLGGKPIDWTDRPHLVLPGEKLQLDVTWNDSTVVGANDGGNKVQQYGINIIGYLVRAGRS